MASITITTMTISTITTTSTVTIVTILAIRRDSSHVPAQPAQTGEGEPHGLPTTARCVWSTGGHEFWGWSSGPHPAFGTTASELRATNTGPFLCFVSGHLMLASVFKA